MTSIPRNRLLLSIIFISIVLALAFALLMSGFAGAQEKPAQATAPLVPTEVQSLRLQVKQRDAMLAKAALDVAQAAFQRAIADLNAAAEQVKTENKWDKGVTFDMNTVTFSAPAPPPAPATKGKP